MMRAFPSFQLDLGKEPFLAFIRKLAIFGVGIGIGKFCLDPTVELLHIAHGIRHFLHVFYCIHIEILYLQNWSARMESGIIFLSSSSLANPL